LNDTATQLLEHALGLEVNLASCMIL